MPWKRKIIDKYDPFYRIFQAAIKKVNYPKDELTIKVKDQFFKFLFQWEDENQCGIEVMEEIK